MNFYQDGSLPFQLICGFSFAEDKCARCDVHAHCENGKCVCDGGYYGAGTLGECFRVGGMPKR